MHHHLCLIFFSLIMDFKKTMTCLAKCSDVSAPSPRPLSGGIKSIQRCSDTSLETEGGGPPPCWAPTCRCRWLCWPCWGPAAAWNFRSNRCLSMIALNLISVLRITFTVSFQLFFCNISISMFVIDIDLLIKGSLSDLGFCGIFVLVFSFFFLFC